MCEARTVMVALVIHEDLRFIFEATEGHGMNDTVTVALVRRAHGAFLFRYQSATRFVGLYGVRC